jgi:hypothetical protein
MPRIRSISRLTQLAQHASQAANPVRGVLLLHPALRAGNLKSALAEATSAWASSMTTPLRAEVPRSRPIYMSVRHFAVDDAICSSSRATASAPWIVVTSELFLRDIGRTPRLGLGDRGGAVGTSARSRCRSLQAIGQARPTPVAAHRSLCGRQHPRRPLARCVQALLSKHRLCSPHWPRHRRQRQRRSRARRPTIRPSFG